MWGREQKKLSECKAALKAAKSKYTLLGQELARVSCKINYPFLNVPLSPKDEIRLNLNR